MTDAEKWWHELEVCSRYLAAMGLWYIPDHLLTSPLPMRIAKLDDMWRKMR